MIVVPTPLAQAIMNYLAQQKFAEVEGMINGLRNCKPLPSPAETVAEETTPDENTASDKAATRKVHNAAGK